MVKMLNKFICKKTYGQFFNYIIEFKSKQAGSLRQLFE